MRIVKPLCPVSAVVSWVVTMLNAIAAAEVPARMDPSPVAHSIVCCVDAASVFEATVSVMIVADDVAAISVAVVLPTATVHTGNFAATQIAKLAVMVMVSDTSAAPAVPVLRTPFADRVNVNLCLTGAMPSVSWFNEVAEPHTTGVAARVVYVPQDKPVVLKTGWIEVLQRSAL